MDSSIDPENVVTQAARNLYAIYNETGSTPWKTSDGRDAPPWDGLSYDVRQKWEAVSLLALEAKITLAFAPHRKF